MPVNELQRTLGKHKYILELHYLDWIEANIITRYLRTQIKYVLVATLLPRYTLAASCSPETRTACTQPKQPAELQQHVAPPPPRGDNTGTKCIRCGQKQLAAGGNRRNPTEATAFRRAPGRIAPQIYAPRVQRGNEARRGARPPSPIQPNEQRERERGRRAGEETVAVTCAKEKP